MSDINQLRASWVRKIEVASVDGVTVPGECWLWRGYCDKKSGYGRVCVPMQKRSGYMHRVVYELLVGPIPHGLHIDHLCRQPACCNPAHLEPVTCLVNVRRGSRASQTHCKRNHPLSGDNLYTYTSKKGVHRRCRTCHEKYIAEWRAARKERKQQTWAKYWPVEEDAA